MNKGLTITLISLLSLLLIFLVGIMIFLFNGKINLDGFRIASGYSEKLVEEKGTIKENIKPEEAEQIKEKLMAAGATVEIK